MTDPTWKLLLFIKDFTGRGTDVFYWYQNGQLDKTDIDEIIKYDRTIVCHDFWMIRDVIFDKTGRLPREIIDLDEFRISTSGHPADRLAREKHDITAALEIGGVDRDLCASYRRMFNKIMPFDLEIATKTAKALEDMFLKLVERADAAGETKRFFEIEVPVFQRLQSAMAAGIAIDTKQLTTMRSDAEHEYFIRLKNYSAKHDMPLETPNKSALEEKLRFNGFDLDDVSVDYLLEYLPHEKDFGSDTMGLLEADNVRKVLTSLSFSTTTIRPVVDVFGSRTSRVQLRSPSLQNIPKKYRSMIVARADAHLSYVDFDQYEVGIMAALSGDTELMSLYAAGDMYDLFATTHLGLSGNRKAAKQLFLSYAYGMSKKSLIDAAVSLGVDRQRAKAALGLFKQYESWKKSIWERFRADSRVETILGNHFLRELSGPLSSKEQRSAVSQVVQGTASLIFKISILDACKLDDVTIVLPMHDALLFEHRSPDTPSKVVSAFENAMTVTLNNKVKGKASVGAFATN